MSKMNYNRKVRKTRRKFREKDWVCHECGRFPCIKFIHCGTLSGKHLCEECLTKFLLKSQVD